MVSRVELAHGEARRRISREADRQVRRAWIGSRSEDEFAAAARAVADAARSALVAEVDGYMALALTAQGAQASPQGLDPSDYRRPVDPEVLWRRPHVHMRTKLAEGMPASQAVAFGGHMATALVQTDLQLAGRTAARDWMVSDGRPRAWQRVLGSGGASGENCGLCIVASTQRYWVEDLMPIHVHCTCEVRPLLDTSRQVVRPDDLDQVKARIDEMDGTYLNRNDMGRVRISVDDLPTARVWDHGELGPYLSDAAHRVPTVAAA